jgi:hypothetical protein
MMTKETGASATAIIALCLSVMNAAFSFFQWWNGERESHITAAVEISKNYINKEQEEREKSIAPVLKTLFFGKDSISGDELESIARHGEIMAYVAFLANKNRLDKSYLASSLVCDIVWTDKAFRTLVEKEPRIQQTSVRKEMEIFAGANPCEIILPTSPPK